MQVKPRINFYRLKNQQLNVEKLKNLQLYVEKRLVSKFKENILVSIS